MEDILKRGADSLSGPALDGKGKARPSGARSGLELLSYLTIRWKTRAIRFDQNVNHINVETAIRLRRETAGRSKDAAGWRSAVRPGDTWRDPVGMSRRAVLGILPDDLYVPIEPWPRIGRPPKHDPSAWTVTDDWPDPVPITDAELDVFAAWFGDLFDEMFDCASDVSPVSSPLCQTSEPARDASSDSHTR